MGYVKGFLSEYFGVEKAESVDKKIIIKYKYNESTYFICPAVESWNLGGTFQEATAAFSQMLSHPGVQ